MKKLLGLVMVAVIFSCLAGVAWAEDKPKLGMPMTTLDDAFWVRYVKFAEQAADALGYELIVTDARQKEDKQLADIESLINSGVKGIILTPLSEPLGVRALEICNEAKVPVVCTDTYPGVDAGQFEYYLTFIKLDDEKAGYTVAKSLIDLGAKKFVGIGGPPGISTSEARNDGLKKAVKESKGVKLLDLQYTDWTMAKGQSVMEDFLTRFEKIDAVWGAGSDPLLGSIVSIENAGRKGEMMLAGIDLTSAALEALENGELTVLGGGHWCMGGYGILVIHDFLNGHKTDKPVYEISLHYVRKDGVQKYRKEVIEPLDAGKWLVDWGKISKAKNSAVNHEDVIKVVAPH
jgi:ABC-type sugar transport system substrate-binding protein